MRLDRASEAADNGSPLDNAAPDRISLTEEDQHVTLEQLQVLTEELEAANTSLHEMNRELDRRVEERTRDIETINAALRASIPFAFATGYDRGSVPQRFADVPRLEKPLKACQLAELLRPLVAG